MEKVSWRSASRCVCVRRISLGGEGNVLFPVLSSLLFVVVVRKTGTVTRGTGGVLKKTVLSAAAMTAAAAVCYPREATDISKYSWNLASEFATSTYHELFDCKSRCVCVHCVCH